MKHKNLIDMVHRRLTLYFRKKKSVEWDNKPTIYEHVGIKSTAYPENWLERVSYTCSDGTILTYNPVTNAIATDEALKQLKKDTIAGKTLSSYPTGSIKLTK